MAAVVNRVDENASRTMLGGGGKEHSVKKKARKGMDPDPSPEKKKKKKELHGGAGGAKEARKAAQRKAEMGVMKETIRRADARKSWGHP